MELFRFGPLHLDDLGLSLLAGVGILVVLEIAKPYWQSGVRAQRAYRELPLAYERYHGTNSMRRRSI